MINAADKLKKEIENTKMEIPKKEVICNVTANYVSSVEQLKKNMFCQVYSSVLWRQTVEKMINEGVREFVEIGHGKTLTNIIKKINGNVLTATINKVEDLENYKSDFMN